MSRAYRSRRSKKANPNLTVLVAASCAAAVIPFVYGIDSYNLLSAATLTVMALSMLMALAFGSFVYLQVSTRKRRQEAVSDKKVDKMSWQEFELSVMQLLKAQGYKINDHPSSSGDQGADIIASIKREKYAIQVKHYKGKLSNTPVQEAVAAKAFYGCQRAMVVTNSHFTAGAKILAVANDCILVDREILGAWILTNKKA